MTNPSADPLVGRTVAHYQILSRLGGGGMGVVYKAVDQRLSRPVALKFLPQQWSHDDTARQRFVREAQAASATHHPNICTVHDIATADDGQLFIVMGYYEGPTLKQRLASGALPIDEALDIATQLADGLAKAHAQGVVHRDIKPGNIILSGDGVCIVDFGLATFVDALQLTAEGSTLGTAAYMSPEQVRGGNVDARTDVWAAGIVLYEMLTGHVPFRGTHAEAISYAIRNDPPPAIRTERPEVPEDVEQLVFRALHKDPAIRFASGRELARALRQVRGFTVPQDLRSAAIDVPPSAAALGAPPRRARRRALLAAAAVAALLVVGTPLWLLYPVDHVRVAVTPVINRTGDAQLDPYRMALTYELVRQLGDVPGIDVVPYARLLELVQRFRATGGDVSSREALQAIGTHTGVEVLLVPTLLYEDGAWRARVDFRDAATGESTATETDPVLSSLARSTAHRLMIALAGHVREHVVRTGSRRAYVAERLRAAFAPETAAASARLRPLEALKAFEEGLQAYEQMEFAAAREAFATAAEHDPADPVAVAWRSRVAGLMRQDKDALEAADRASRLDATPLARDERLFVEAVVAEAKRDTARAEDRYRQLQARRPDSPERLIELAGFYDRQGRAIDARNTYHEALTLASAAGAVAANGSASLPRVQLELCRLNSPTRLDETALARDNGQRALQLYRELGHPAGEAQALWCLADVLRTGGDGDRQQARAYALEALAIVEELDYPYALARAYNYVGLVALSARNGSEAAAYFERTLASARRTGNVLLESRTLMNLGVAYEMLGRRPEALAHYRESFALSEVLGNQQDAAWNQVNAAAILVEYGGAPEEGLRDAQNALGVFQSLGDRYFEIAARRVIGWYYRYVGRPDDALRELTVAHSLAREHNLNARIAHVLIDLAKLRFDAADYAGARQLLTEALEHASGTDRVHAHIELARADTRLARFADAARELAAAAAELEATGDEGSLPLLHAARGEAAYESGDLAGAHAHFERAALFWTDELPEAPSVEAKAYAGVIDALQGRVVRGRAAVAASLDQAMRMRRVALTARARLFLARIDIGQGRIEEAIRTLAEIREDAIVSPELRAQVHHWRGQALSRRGDAAAAAAERTRAAAAVDTLRQRVPAASRDDVLRRPDLRLLVQPKAGLSPTAFPRKEVTIWMTTARERAAATAASGGRSATGAAAARSS